MCTLKSKRRRREKPEQRYASGEVRRTHARRAWEDAALCGSPALETASCVQPSVPGPPG